MNRFMAIAGLSLLLVSSGCVAVSSKAEQKPGPRAGRARLADKKPPAETAENNDEEDPQLARARLVRQLDIARKKVEKARLALDHQQIQDQEKIARATTARELAATKLRDLQEHSAPQRIEEARLEMLRTEDWVTENEEELAQLEMMYAEEDLADKTREIVLARGHRSLERSRRELTLRRTALANLEERDLPREIAELRLEMDEKAAELTELRRDADVNLLDQRIALMEAEDEVARIEEDIRKHDQKQKNEAEE